MKTQEDSDVQQVMQHAKALGEYFDAVHIFCTRDEPATENGTVFVDAGCGNWYARYGQVKDWILKQEMLSQLKTEQEFDEDNEEED